MDKQVRRLLRRHREAPGDAELHSMLLRSAIRANLVDKDKALLCAYWGHKGARYLFPTIVRKDGVIFKSTKLSYDLYDRYNKTLELIDESVILSIAKSCLNKLSKVKAAEITYRHLCNQGALFQIHTSYLWLSDIEFEQCFKSELYLWAFGDFS